MLNRCEGPKVSLLVPIYNVEKYLEQCLDSALKQTLRDIEIICINDGSTDGSRAIIEKYLKYPQFRVIDKTNSGYGHSMNRGLDECRGEYVGILESDDFLEPDALMTLYEAAKSNDADVVKSDFYLYWSVPEERSERFNWVTDELAGTWKPLEQPQVFYRKPSIWSAIYRRDFLDSHQIRFLETPGASYQDAGFNFKVWAMADRVVLLNEAFLYYRQDNEASSVNSPGKVYCVCDEYAEMLRYISAYPEKKKLLDPVLVKMRYDSYMWNYERLSEDLRAEFVTRMASDFKAEDEAGVTDYALFEPWKVADRKLIVEDPKRFHAIRGYGEASSLLEKAARHYRVGGALLVAKIVAEKLFRR